ncbi:hypothetical protein DICPUDRAFT_152393 [Dictyostelium purpureum]|uniref:Clu domain-containing protein n=1 Tax=Dictyostelium purpureum TaxID=5786 RepID=F0ZL85_DICPU|nr:uncharacterized protein DICPUDRAFT_152393 [Dictyostelium purpureum]EGC35315.1 hypothetical protein DICPUDRAFT_152393 [Dictyostelium purpureum]|eukprot:XP_003288182.1 hypothetical protein DICPUDRAFT_152393 [Dictyostelium purpureum]
MIKNKVYIYDIYSYFEDLNTSSNSKNNIKKINKTTVNYNNVNNNIDNNINNNNNNNNNGYLEPNLLNLSNEPKIKNNNLQHREVQIGSYSNINNNKKEPISYQEESLPQPISSYQDEIYEDASENEEDISTEEEFDEDDHYITDGEEKNNKVINYTPDIYSPPNEEGKGKSPIKKKNNLREQQKSPKNIPQDQLHLNSSNLISQLNRYCTKEFKSKDWNGEFQNLLQQPNSEQKFRKLSHLAKDFVFTAKSYATIIINELCVPLELKTIKPVDVGGFAGGLKYHCQGILFKFAMDTMLNNDCWMYGGDNARDDYAAKAASNELKGLISYYMAGVKGLNYPLMALIDYKGFRLIALSVLPISNETIKYGSSDSGSIVHSNIPDLNEKMKEAGKKLNLKAHHVGSVSGFTKELTSPGDIEGHLGEDNRYYVIDFSRTFPPESIIKQPNVNKRCIFYNLLRPEFVSKWKVPLCSDSFSGWQRNDPNKLTHNKEVEEATNYLVNDLVKQLAQKFDQERSGIMKKLNADIKQISAVSSTVVKEETPSDFNQIKQSFAVKFIPILQKRFEDQSNSLLDNPNTISDYESSVNYSNLLTSLDSNSSSSQSIQTVTSNNDINNNNTSPLIQVLQQQQQQSLSQQQQQQQPQQPNQPNQQPKYATRPLNHVKNEVPQQLLRIIEEMHRSGINIRHMGRVRFYTKSKNIRDLLLLEMTARSIKTIIRDEMRLKMKEEQGLSEEPFKEIIIEIFNKILQKDQEIWSRVLNIIRSKYYMAFMKEDDEEINNSINNNPLNLNNNNNLNNNSIDNVSTPSTTSSYSNSSLKTSSTSSFKPPYKEEIEEGWMDCVNIKNLLDRLQLLAGISFTPAAQSELSRNHIKFQLVDSDILDIHANIKHMNIIDYAEGRALSIAAKQKENSLRLLKMSSLKFQVSLKSNPDNIECIYQLGRNLTVEAKTIAKVTGMFGRNIYVKTLEDAAAKFLDAVSISNTFILAHYKLGRVYSLMAHYHQNNLYKSSKLYKMASIHYRRAIECFRKKYNKSDDSTNNSFQNYKFDPKDIIAKQNSDDENEENEELVEFYILNGLENSFLLGLQGSANYIVGVSIVSQELEDKFKQYPNLLILIGKSFIYRPYYDDINTPIGKKNRLDQQFHQSNKNNYYQDATMKFHQALLLNSSLKSIVFEIAVDIWLKSKTGNRKLYYPASNILGLLVRENFYRDDTVYSMYVESLLEILKMENSSLFLQNKENSLINTDIPPSPPPTPPPLPLSSPLSSPPLPSLPSSPSSYQLPIQNQQNIYLIETRIVFEGLFQSNNNFIYNKLENAIENQQNEITDFIKISTHSSIIKAKLTQAIQKKKVLKLNLHRTLISDQDLNTIGEIFGNQLQELDISGCPLVSDYGASEFLSTYGKHLTTLILADTLISDKTISILSNFCQQIQKLDIQNCFFINPEALSLLSHIQKLKIINVSRCKITNNTILSFNQHQNITNIQQQIISTSTISNSNNNSLITSNFTNTTTTTTTSNLVLNNKQIQELIIKNPAKLSDDAFQQFQSWQTLKILDLSGCSKLSDNVFFNLPECLNLEQLILEACYNLTDKSAKSIASIMPNLWKLSLKGLKFLTDEGVQTIVEKCKKIKDLKLSRCHTLTSYSADLIAEHLGDTLERIDLSICPQIVEESLINLLKKCTPKLIAINFSENQTVSEETIKVINESFPNLQHLRLDSCVKIKSDGFEFKIPSLKTLSLMKSQIYHHSLAIISLSLTNLTSLSLKGCFQLTDSSFQTIKNLVHLENLDISDNYRVLDTPMVDICKNLFKLKHLDISSCLRLTTKTFFLIGKYLTKLETLIMSGCGNLTDAALVYISENLISIKSLDVSGCQMITDTSIKSLANNQVHLQSLSLKDCKSITQHSIDIVKNKCPLFKLVRLSLHSLPIVGELKSNTTDILKPIQYPVGTTEEWKKISEEKKRNEKILKEKQQKLKELEDLKPKYRDFNEKLSYKEIMLSKEKLKLDLKNLEKYLKENDFLEIFKMNPDSFSKLPHWRRDDLKKKAHLF